MKHVLNSMTPHMHTSSPRAALFSFSQRSDKMCKRQAEFLTESTTAKQKRVRVRSSFNQFVIKHHEPTAKHSQVRS